MGEPPMIETIVHRAEHLPVNSKQYSWRFFLTPHEAWDAMFHDCEKATQSIEFEQYIFQNDALGHKFIRLFIEKAKRGVKVFIICDFYGSQSLAHEPLINELRTYGGQFYFYNSIGLLRRLWPRKWFPRTHVKTLLVDSVIVYTGGVCLAERMRNWRDTQIRITGPAVAQVRTAFDHIERALTHKGSAKVRDKQHISQEFTYLQSSPVSLSHIIYHELIRALGSAENYIYLSTAFFAPNRRFRRTLMKARARGVKVILLVPIKSDIVVADWLYLSYATGLLKVGIRIFCYTPLSCTIKQWLSIIDGQLLEVRIWIFLVSFSIVRQPLL